MDLKEQTIACPHCGHHIHLTLDASGGDQDYYEDCPACCHPIHLNLHINELRQKLELNIDSGDEQIF